MRVALGLITGLLLMAASGCSMLGLQESLYSDYGVRELNVNGDSASVKLKAAITKSDANKAGLVDADCFTVPIDMAADANRPMKCQQQRNAAIVTLLTASDDMCQAHFKTIYGNDASFNIVTGSITNLASGIATAAGGLTAKSALAAVAFFANAERSLVNETIYKNLLVTAVTMKIREVRDAKAMAIIPGKLKEPINDYPMLMAIHEIISYHYTCSFMFGLEKALKEGIQSTADSRRVKLEQERQFVEFQLATKIKSLTEAKVTPENFDSDVAYKGLKDRLLALDAELVKLVQELK